MSLVDFSNTSNHYFSEIGKVSQPSEHSQVLTHYSGSNVGQKITVLIAPILARLYSTLPRTLQILNIVTLHNGVKFETFM
jgi:hypothetical protein